MRRSPFAALGAAGVALLLLVTACKSTSVIPHAFLPQRLFVANHIDATTGSPATSVAVFPIPNSASESPIGTINTSPAQPVGVAVDPTNRNVFVSIAAGSILAYARPNPSTSTTLFSLSGFTAPQLMSFDTSGDLFVPDVSTGNVSEISHPVTSSSVATTLAITGFTEPICTAIDSANNLYVNAADGGVGALLMYGPSHSGAATASTSNGRPLNGYLCALDPKTQQVFIATDNACCPSSIAGYNTPLTANESPSVVITLPTDAISYGIGFDSLGNLYVSTFNIATSPASNIGISVYTYPVTSGSTPAFTLNNGNFAAGQIAE